MEGSVSLEGVLDVHARPTVEAPPFTAKDATVNNHHLTPCGQGTGESTASSLPSSAMTHRGGSMVRLPQTHKAYQWHTESGKTHPT